MAKYSPLEKILTVSFEEYLASLYVSNKKDDYMLVGVHVDGIARKTGNIMKAFAKKVPRVAEAVVNYRVSLAGTSVSRYFVASGTALIPRERIAEYRGKKSV